MRFRSIVPRPPIRIDPSLTILASYSRAGSFCARLGEAIRGGSLFLDRSPVWWVPFTLSKSVKTRRPSCSPKRPRPGSSTALSRALGATSAPDLGRSTAPVQPGGKARFGPPAPPGGDLRQWVPSGIGIPIRNAQLRSGPCLATSLPQQQVRHCRWLKTNRTLPPYLDGGTSDVRAATTSHRK